VSVKKLNCPKCGESLSFSAESQHPIFRKMEVILKSRKDAYDKKLALFNCLKNIELKDLEPLEEKRINFLLQGRLYNELAKRCMKEYKKLTVEDFGKKE